MVRLVHGEVSSRSWLVHGDVSSWSWLVYGRG